MFAARCLCQMMSVPDMEADENEAEREAEHEAGRGSVEAYWESEPARCDRSCSFGAASPFPTRGARLCVQLGVARLRGAADAGILTDRPVRRVRPSQPNGLGARWSKML